MPDDHNLAIFYKKSDSLQNKEFTIARELGYCCLHCSKDESDLIELCVRIIFRTVLRMRTFDDMLSKQLQDDEFRKEYEAIQPEMDVIRAIVDARTSQNITQKELEERTGINQADISKLENGTRNPSVNLLKRLADGMGMALKIEFVPKQNI